MNVSPMAIRDVATDPKRWRKGRNYASGKRLVWGSLKEGKDEDYEPWEWKGTPLQSPEKQ